MRKYRLCCIAVLLLATFRVGAQGIDSQASYETRARQYVKQYAALAMQEQQKNGIPAAITLGQGILETEAGISELVVNANNHFGIKCKNGWLGETYTYTDDAPDECFKKYKCAADSYRDHSEHLKRNQRYAPLFALKQTDYKGWAVCLKKCGYATNPQYAQKLIGIIETFGLEQYTTTAFDSSILNSGNSDYKLYAASYVTPIDSPVKQVAAPKPAQATAPRIIIVNDTHTVKDGETVATIAKMENVDEGKIRAFNYLYTNEEPVPGSVLELQKQAHRKPEVWIHPTTAHTENAIVGADDNAANRNGDYVAINKQAPAAHADQSAPVPESTAIPQVQQAAVNNQPAPRRKYSGQPASAAAAQPTEPDPEKDQQLASLKSDLDKVVYADDSKLIAENATTAATTPTPAKPELQTTAPKSTGKFYTVKKGDTAFSIAKRNNITVDELMKWNNMTAGGVKAGQNLRVKE